MTVVGKKFSVDFQQAVEINGNTQIMVQPEGQPVEKASVEQLGVALMEEDIIVNPDGIYPKMTVGFAENVVGDGSATSEEFSFRPTAGVNRNTLNDGAARIRTLKGNSVVVNQQNKGVNTRTQYGYQTSSNGATITITNVSATTPDYGNMADFVDFTIKSGHRYLAITDSTLDLYVNSLVGFFFRANAISDIAPDLNYDAVWLRTETNIPLLVGESESFDFEIIDLTLMFGAGNEPLTVAEFYQRMPLGADLDVYNEGTIIDGHYGAIKTTGFNQWDEQWEQGAFDYYTGAKIADNTRIRSLNFIPVLPDTRYYYKMPTSWQVCYWDADKQFIAASQNGADAVEKTPQNCHYITFNVGYSGDPITDYNNNICISLYWPTEYGNLYGTYKPYKPFERDLSWIKTIKDSTGNALFPNGMRSAGTAHDEIRFNSTTQQWEAVKRVDVVDLGTLKWGMQADSNIFTTTIEGIVPADTHEKRQNGILCEKYGIAPSTDVNTFMQDGSILRYDSGVAIRDTSFPRSADFTTAMQGVLLNYELAEPIVTPITENINFDYDVSDYGTEELIVAEGVESAPLSANIEYSPNVLAVLKNAPDIANDVDALKSQVAALPEPAAYVLNTEQTLTEEQKEQARKNIGAASTSYIISVFEEIKALIKNGDYDEVVAVLDKAILDFATLG